MFAHMSVKFRQASTSHRSLIQTGECDFHLQEVNVMQSIVSSMALILVRCLTKQCNQGHVGS